jgi:hypothetical protein
MFLDSNPHFYALCAPGQSCAHLAGESSGALGRRTKITSMFIEQPFIGYKTLKSVGFAIGSLSFTLEIL